MRHFEIWFPKKKTITFFWSKLSKLHKKRPNFACDNYIFPKTRGNKNKQCTHSTAVKGLCPWFEHIVLRKGFLLFLKAYSSADLGVTVGIFTVKTQNWEGKYVFNWKSIIKWDLKKIVSTCISRYRSGYSLFWRGCVEIVNKREVLNFSLDIMLNCIYSNLIYA